MLSSTPTLAGDSPAVVAVVREGAPGFWVESSVFRGYRKAWVKQPHRLAEIEALRATVAGQKRQIAAWAATGTITARLLRIHREGRADERALSSALTADLSECLAQPISTNGGAWFAAGCAICAGASVGVAHAMPRR